MQEKNKIFLKFVLFLFILIFLIVFLSKPITILLSNSAKFRTFLLDFGIFSPIILIIIIILQVIIAPIPGQAAGLASGYVFGLFKGTFFSMIGLIIGSYLAFFLSKKLGRPFVEKMFNKKSIKKYNKIISEKGIFPLFLMFLLPLFPDDALCFIVGLTKIKTRTFILISSIGRLPGFFILNLVGSGLASSNSKISLLILIVTLLVSVIIYINRRRLEKFLSSFKIFRIQRN